MNEMVMIVAYVRRARRLAVGQALRQLEQGAWTEADVLGHGQAAAGHGVEHVRFELVVEKSRAEACGHAIEQAAATGVDGDGIIAVMPVLSTMGIGSSR